ncbi:ER lumen protein-retaining receptor A [Phytophthora citrophthora]|uniref:ER lumen protein-retaining receptor A n=1 Tax=Phytophthora citrophthora TaxID=4793 RepID=A0AAD9GE90_9STRA|nr:ER lumen protein-retaining receptor A [Phytophthora citrophthora]
MNLFRLVGDMAHLASFLVLLLKLLASRSANGPSRLAVFSFVFSFQRDLAIHLIYLFTFFLPGISLKTQELFFLVFVTRYVDLFFHFVSLYNTLMKLLFLLFSGAIVYVIRFKEPFRSTYDKSHDAFLHVKFAILPCALLALVFNEQFEVMEILWTFSIYLEAVAIIPQLILLQRHGEVENLTSNYVVLLGAYRGCYVLNWIYRAATETSYHFIWLMFIAGMVQTALYVDFFYYYAMRYT